MTGDFPRKSPISLENRQFSPPSVYLTPPLKGFPLELGIGAGSEKTRMMELPEGRKRFKIGLAVLIQCRRVTDPASHVAVASTRYA